MVRTDPLDVDESTLFDTPVVELDLAVAPTVYAKVEWFNFHALGVGGGSVKSRIATAMIDAAELAGDLDEDTTIIEPSSGNTGAAVARVGCARGYDVEIVTKADAGAGKRRAIREAGARVRTVPADTTYDAIIERVEELVDGGGYYWPNQYANPNNPGVHEATTGAEIRRQVHDVTHVVTGVGTGGTISGVARALNGADTAPEEGTADGEGTAADGTVTASSGDVSTADSDATASSDDVTMIGYEPAADSTDIEGLRYLRTGDHPYQAAYEEERLDGKRYLRTDEAHMTARWLRRRYDDREVRIHDAGQHEAALVRDGLRVESDLADHPDGAFVVGPSSGGNVALVTELAREGTLDADDVVVTLLCDRGDRYRESLWEDL